MNCFNIPNTYFGYTIHQGPDDRLYGVPEGWDHDDGDPEAASWDELREVILGRVESNASGSMRWESVSAQVNAERAS